MHMVQVRQGAPGRISAPPIHHTQMYMFHARNIESPKVSAPPAPEAEVNMTQKGGLTKREMKKFTREVNLAEATMAITPEYINWSEQSITFSRADHPPSVPRPGHAALVVGMPNHILYR